MKDRRRNERTTYEYDHVNRLTLADTNHCTGSSDSSCTEGRQYYLTDSTGSVVGLTQQSGTIANRYRYDLGENSYIPPRSCVPERSLRVWLRPALDLP